MFFHSYQKVQKKSIINAYAFLRPFLFSEQMTLNAQLSRTGNKTGNLHAHLRFEHIGQDGKYDGQDVHGIEIGNHIRLKGWI